MGLGSYVIKWVKYWRHHGFLSMVTWCPIYQSSSTNKYQLSPIDQSSIAQASKLNISCRRTSESGEIFGGGASLIIIQKQLYEWFWRNVINFLFPMSSGCSAWTGLCWASDSVCGLTWVIFEHLIGRVHWELPDGWSQLTGCMIQCECYWLLQKHPPYLSICTRHR